MAVLIFKDDREVKLDAKYIEKFCSIVELLSEEEKLLFAFEIAKYFNFVNYSTAISFIKFILKQEEFSNRIYYYPSGIDVNVKYGSRKNILEKNKKILYIEHSLKSAMFLSWI